MSLLTNTPNGDDGLHSLPKPSARIPESATLSKHDKYLMKLAKIPTAAFLDFSNTVYVNAKVPVTVRCVLHGEFTVKNPSSLVTGLQCCPTCSKQFGIKNLSHAEVLQLHRYLKDEVRELRILDVMTDDTDTHDEPSQIDYYDGELSSKSVASMYWSPAFDYHSHEHNTKEKFNY